MRVVNVRFEHHREPLGIGESRPRLSWSFVGPEGNWEQKSAEIEITNFKKPHTVQTHQVNTSESLYLPWPTTPLQSRESASVRVRALSESSQWTDWSESVVVEAGLLNPHDWQATLIECGPRPDTSITFQPVLFRREFHLSGDVASARLYISAHGIYEVEINGARVGDHVLAPGWTPYTYELPYQTFDVTSHLLRGLNAIGVQVAEGWYCGRLGFAGGRRNIWGDRLGIIVQLVVESSDRASQVIASDHEWTYSQGPILQAEIYDGETYDSRIDMNGWSKPGYYASHWQKPHVGTIDYQILKAPDGPPVRRMEELPAIKLLHSPSEKIIIDFGQNLVGWVRVSLSGPSGHTVRLIHAEVLEHGEIAITPLRTARATDTIILNGHQVTYEPRFTFHGFRYVQLENWPVPLDEINLEDFTAVVIYSDMCRVGWLECSEPMLNKLHQNVVWSMKGNFISVPTDCPQRDERLGWTGDIQAFAPTAAFLFEPYGMLRTWLRGVAKEQEISKSGAPPMVSPDVLADFPRAHAAIWGDSVVTVPWDLYTSSGDPRIIRDQYSSMTDWLTKGIKRDSDSRLWDPKNSQLGDWLEPGSPDNEPGNGPTDELLVADSFLIHVTDLMVRVCSTLGLDNNAEQYRRDAKILREKFSRRYITADGRVVSDTQTAMALAIHFSLFSTPEQERVAADRLVYIIKANSRFKIATGFAGTPIIGHALNKAGETQIFYRMLYHKKNPSWLYPVTMGATTIWERWDSMLPDGTVHPSPMTSFNHYALGSVANWMHTTIAGLTPLEPGWKKVSIRPIPGGTITSCSARFLSPYGEVRVDWDIKDNTMHLTAMVAPNTTAEIVLPAQSVRLVGSGKHEFVCQYTSPEWPPRAIYPPVAFMEPDDEL